MHEYGPSQRQNAWVASAAAVTFATVLSAGASWSSTIQTLSDSFVGEAGEIVLSVAQFDEALGDLTSVQVIVSGIAEDSASTVSTPTICRAGRPGSPPVCTRLGRARAEADAALSIVGINGLIARDNDTAQADCLAAATPNATCTATATAIAEIVGAVETTAIDASNVSDFVGDGLLAFRFVPGSGDTLKEASVTVSYTYAAAAIPLPGTALVLGTGLCTLALTRHRLAQF
ncbi:MAG: hypothetical protein AAGF71_12270 [Pseudomonadota bacterium]